MMYVDVLFVGHTPGPKPRIWGYLKHNKPFDQRPLSKDYYTFWGPAGGNIYFQKVNNFTNAAANIRKKKERYKLDISLMGTVLTHFGMFVTLEKLKHGEFDSNSMAWV